MLDSRHEPPISTRCQLTVLIAIAPLATAGAAPFVLQRTYLGAQPHDQFGSAVHAAGDVNADGFADFVIGATSVTEALQGVARSE